MMKAANANALQEVKDVTPEIAAKVRAAWCTLTRAQLIEQYECVRERVRECFNPPHTDDLRRTAINFLIGTHGVEYLGTSRKTDCPVYYCNAGDTYACTIIFSGNSLRIGCWGDMVERKTIKERD
jgi:hypothetical protein